MRIGAIAIAIAATFAVANVETSVFVIALLVGPEVLRAAVERRCAFAAREAGKGEPTNDRVPWTATVASRAALCLTSTALAGSVVLLVAGEPISSAVAVLIVAGSAGMKSATLIPMRAAINRARRRGAIIEDGAHLEGLWSADAVAIDADETVTLPEIVVRAVYPTGGVSPQEVLQAGAAAESRCQHPIAHAIVRYAREKNVSIPVSGRCTHTPGQGVRAFVDGQETVVGNSEYVTAGRMPDPAEDERAAPTVFVVRGGRYLGAIALVDVPRAETKQAIADLKSLAVKTYLLTCDARPATTRVARELGVDSFETGLTPDERRRKLRALVSSRRVAALRGRIDDAGPSTNGAAAGGRSDAEGSERDLSVGADDLPKVVEILRVARHARALVLQNSVGTSVVVVIGIVLAANGVLTPLMAAVVHAGSEALFILNATRSAAPRPA